MRVNQLTIATVATAVGIYIGDAQPLGISYLFLSFTLLVASSFLFERYRWSVPLSAFAWMTLAACRASLTWEWGSDVLFTIQSYGEQVQHYLLTRLSKAHLSPECLQLTSAMALGNKSMLTQEMRQLFSETGSSHLLAISGLHMGIIFLLIRTLSDRLFYLFPPRIGLFLRRKFPLLVMWIYAFITGLQPPVVRASIMITLCMATFPAYALPSLFGRRFMLCVFIMLWLSPAYAFQLGFWLSILALASIVWLYVPLSERYFGNPYILTPLQRAKQYIVGLLGVSLAAQLATAPLSLYYFHTLPLIGFLWNLALIPLTTLVLFVVPVVLILPNALTGSLLNLLSDVFFHVQETAASVPHVVLHDLHPSFLQVVLLYLLFFLLLLRLHASLERHGCNKY